jgi:ubiquinone/menaquinone biosynthesis C-methylase UbiE
LITGKEAMEANLWFDNDCAKAFWDQRHGKSYLDLLRATGERLDVRTGDTWIDLGCGSGQLTALLWQRSAGTIGRIHALDCAPANRDVIDKLAVRLSTGAGRERIRFEVHDLSRGLPQFAASSIDGVVSGLAISYAESFDAKAGRYTDEAYNSLLADVHRVLRPGGQFVFSVNVPKPRFWNILIESFVSGLFAPHARRVFFNSLRMQLYGRWLKKEAGRGRFHFFPIHEIKSRLAAARFTGIEHTVSYAGQAYVVRAIKPFGS